MKSRIVLLFSGFVLMWSILIVRAAYLQFLPNDRLQNLQQRQFQTQITLQSRRGAIVDTNGRDLALSASAYSVFADPKLIEAKKYTARKLAKELGSSVDGILSKIKDSNRRFVWIQRQIDKEKMERIKSYNLKGIAFVEEWKRVYPNDNLLSQTLGFVGAEGQGLEGIELFYEEKLQSNKKKISVRRDARGRPLSDGVLFAENPDGAEIKLTLDSELQYMLETELGRAINEFDAEDAVGIVLDAKTSAVLAMASAPSFDANKASKLTGDQRRNRAITDLFEPGSTLKTFAIAGALREKKLTPNKKYFCEWGQYKVLDKIIREADSEHKFGWITVNDILAHSSNIGTTKIAFDLGSEKLRSTLLDFGFGQKNGIDLPGEAKGMMQPLPWRPHLLANISFGQGIAASALQVANAYAVIANGGQLMKPYIVQSILDNESGDTTTFEPQAIKRVLSEEDANLMRLMLYGVTQYGTGAAAQVPGFPVGGKTGTAQKVNPTGRGYLPNAYISSFAGFIPVNEPKFVIFVAVDHPKKNAYYGSQVAAPIFSKVASYAVRKAGLSPVLLTEKNVIPAKKQNIVDNSTNVPQIKTANELLQENQQLGQDTKATFVPDLMNLTAREVLRKVSGQDIKIKILGQGVVSEMVPSPGGPMPDDKKITVYLK